MFCSPTCFHLLDNHPTVIYHSLRQTQEWNWSRPWYNTPVYIWINTLTGNQLKPLTQVLTSVTLAFRMNSKYNTVLNLLSCATVTITTYQHHMLVLVQELTSFWASLQCNQKDLHNAYVNYHVCRRYRSRITRFPSKCWYCHWFLWVADGTLFIAVLWQWPRRSPTTSSKSRSWTCTPTQTALGSSTS